ncbi:pyrroline-5-carboxylate reductase [Pseudarthrobacter albicanus]|uniref:pyrroline-5-carboxylate reductase n=1 Tax=Pseudarthrobacter albicanus TaxID=2823873 RepID=UPI001BABFF12|nr:pyrroline-5-carboxylate reductase [Pseudarthrobacter albicanus]
MPRKELENLPPIAILGTGAMGGAIIRGLLNANVKISERIRITGHGTQQMQELTDIYGIEGFDARTDPEANIKAVKGAGIVVLALKPDVIADVLKEISGAVEDGAIIISIAAGITIKTIESLLPETVSVIRVMPNTPALVGKGVSGISAGTRGTIADIAVADALFRTVGTVLTVPESQIDEVTSISGSGPAYVFFLIEQLTTVAEHQGFTPEQAAVLVNGTFRGACELLASSNKSPRELRQLVTSTKGTTAAAVSVLEDGGIREIFEKATGAALRRARQLAG